MIRLWKVASALGGLAVAGALVVAASADSTIDYNTGPIWIADAPAPARTAAGPAADPVPVQVASIDAAFTPPVGLGLGKADTAPQKLLPTSAPSVAAPAQDTPPQAAAPDAAPPSAASAAPPAVPPAALANVPAIVSGEIFATPPSDALIDPALPVSAKAPSVQQAQNLPVPVMPGPISPPARLQTPPSVATPVGTGAPAPAVAPATFTGTSGKDLSIEINRGALVRLQVPADTVFVANPDVADIQVKSPRLIYVYGKRAGETVLYAVDGNDNLLLNTRVVVTHNLQALRTAINSVLPGGGVAISSAGDALVLEGSVSSATQAEDLRRLAVRFAPGDGAVVNNLRVLAPNQINLRVRIAEVSRDTLKQFGINWQNAIKLGGFVFGLAQGAPVLAAGGGFNVGNNGTNSIVGSYRKGNVDLNAVIDALANENLITVLAEPNLTAMSGETANFLAGGEFPIPVVQSSTSNSITVEFKKFGVSLAFTPTVIDGERINLKVRPEVSQLSTVGSVVINSISIPALTTRNAQTTVELASGQSFAIAGLLQHNSQQDASKTPFLGDIPILGALFKSDRYQRNETELVIVVTPYLVKPVSPNAIATPVDGLTPPTDAQRIFYGTKNQQKIPEAGNAPRGRDGNTVIGPAGFQLD